MKNSYQYQSFSRPLFYFIFALSVVVWIMNIVLVVLEGVFGFVGFNNTTQISSTCSSITQTYYYNKYNSNNTTIVSICFAFSIIAVVFSTALTIVLLVLLVKLAKQQVIAFRKSVKIGIYVCCSLLILAAIVPAGYYLSFFKELAKCAVTSYNSSQILAVAIIGIIIVALSVLMWLMFIIYFYERVSCQEKYKEITSNQTEPQQKGQIYQSEEDKFKKKDEKIYNTTHQKQKARKDYYKHEETQQNLYNSPSKRKINTYNKEVERNEPMNNSVIQAKTSPKNTSFYNNQQRKYGPQRSYDKQVEDNPGELVMMRERRNPTPNRDQQDYKQFEIQYRRKQVGKSILPSSGVQQRQYKGSEYYRSGGSPPQRFSPTRNQKQGVLVKYIRGKYAV